MVSVQLLRAVSKIGKLVYGLREVRWCRRLGLKPLHLWRLGASKARRRTRGEWRCVEVFLVCGEGGADRMLRWRLSLIHGR